MISEPNQNPARQRVLLCGAGFTTPAIHAVLEQLGHDIAGTATDTEGAARALRRHRPDVVLVDGALPPHGGVAATRRLMRERPTPVVLLVDPSDADELQRALDEGASGYLIRPLRPEDLVPAILLAGTRFRQIELYERLANEMREANERLLISGLREQQYAIQFRKVARAALEINEARSVQEVLRIAAERARDLIGAHLAGVRLSVDPEHPLVEYSSSERDPEWSVAELPDPSGSVILSCRSNRSVRLLQRELSALGAVRTASGAESRAVRGWLAAPLVARSVEHMGVLWLTSKYDGELTEEDEAILVQLAQITSLAVENLQLYEGINERDVAKDRFLATLAHELRNPLGSILNAAQVLRAAPAGERAALRALETIERQARQLSHLVEDLTDVARITQDRLQLRKEAVELGAALREAVEDCRGLIDARHQELSLELPREPVAAEADPVRLQQVLCNLLFNAAKYTPEQGRIRLSLHPEGDEAVIRVRDTGIGIAPELLSSIFTLFVQADQGLARTQGGLGIGLALVRQLIELHGGSVSAFSEGPGRGSEFIVRLPLLR